jgi:hypothetical protein
VCSGRLYPAALRSSLSIPAHAIVTSAILIVAEKFRRDLRSSGRNGHVHFFVYDGPGKRTEATGAFEWCRVMVRYPHGHTMRFY